MEKTKENDVVEQERKRKRRYVCVERVWTEKKRKKDKMWEGGEKERKTRDILPA
jgi:hypothetical protein